MTSVPYGSEVHLAMAQLPDNLKQRGLVHGPSDVGQDSYPLHKFAPSAHQSAMGALDLSRGRRFRPVLQKTPFGDLPDLEAHVAIVSHEAIEIGFSQHE